MKTKQQLISDLKDGSFVAEKMETKLINLKEKENCDLLPDEKNIYIDIIFNQSNTCDQEQERIKNVYNENEMTGNKILISEIVEKQIVKVSSVNSNVGEYTAFSCLDIKNHLGDKGDGKYKISLNGVEETVYCDMNNGGWTMLFLTGTDKEIIELTELNINKNNPPSVINHDRYDYAPRVKDFISLMTKDTVIKFTCKDLETSALKTYYHKGIEDYNNYFNLNTGVIKSTKIKCASNEEFTVNYGNETDSCLTGNNELHRYYSVPNEVYGWALYAGTSYPKTLRHCGENWIGDGAGKQSQGYIWYK